MNGSTAKSWLRAAMVLGAGCLASCEVDDALDDEVGTASDALVPCLATDESINYPSSYTLKNTNGSALVANQDITVALQAAIDAQSLKANPRRPVIVIPPGSYRISSTIRLRAARGLSIVGASVAGSGVVPTISWVGPTDKDMFLVDSSPWTRLNRLVLDGGTTARVGVHFMQSKQSFVVDAATDKMTSSFPVLDGTPMVPVDAVAAGLAAGTTYYVRTTPTPGTYCLAASTTLPGCTIDLPVSGAQAFRIAPGFESESHEITDVTVQGMKYGVVGGVYAKDLDGTYPGHGPCPAGATEGDGTPECVPLAVAGLQDTGEHVNGVSIRRSTFVRITQQGVVVNAAGATDWAIFDSTFESNATGVFFGIGQGSVFASRFAANTRRDIHVAGMLHGMLRDNASVGSRQFLRTEYGVGTISIVNNKVDNSAPPGGAAAAAPAMDLRNRTITLVDNRIKRSVASPNPPAVAFIDNAGTKALDVVDGGNITQPALVFPSAPVARRVSISPNTSSAVSVVLPAKPPVGPWLNRPTTEVTANASGKCCILASCGECGTMLASPADGSAVHFAAGLYNLVAPITVPAGRNVLYYGDGVATRFTWVGTNLNMNPMDDPNVVPSLLFDLRGNSRASLRDMALFRDPVTPADSGMAAAILIRSTDDVGNRVHVGHSRMNGPWTGFWVEGYDHLSARLDRVAIRQAGLGIVAAGKNAGQADGSGATKGVVAFGGGLSAFGEPLRVEGYGKLVSQGATIDGGTVGTTFVGSGFATIAAARHFAANTEYLACANDFAPAYVSSSNFGLYGNFPVRASLVDLWTTGLVLGNVDVASTARLLAVNVTNDFVDEPIASCDGHPYAPPESIYAYPAAPACAANGASDPYAGKCPFVALDATEVTAGEQASLNGRFVHESTDCSVACANDANASANAFAATMLSDLRASRSNDVPSTCGPTDVRIHHVLIEGHINTGSWDPRVLQWGIRVH